MAMRRISKMNTVVAKLPQSHSKYLMQFFNKVEESSNLIEESLGNRLTDKPLIIELPDCFEHSSQISSYMSDDNSE